VPAGARGNAQRPDKVAAAAAGGGGLLRAQFVGALHAVALHLAARRPPAQPGRPATARPATSVLPLPAAERLVCARIGDRAPRAPP
jgi:hypothetical protein